MRRVAFVTDTAHPDLTADDRLAVAPLAALGVEVVPARWGDPFPEVDAAVVRSPWDYHLRLPAFLAWIDALAVPVWNRPDVLRWNADKRYLVELEARGVPIIPTLRVPAEAALADAIRDRGWGDGEVVVKPEVSGGGHATFRLRADDLDRLATVEAAMRAARGVFHVQPFLPSVATDGELSLVFFAGRYSHALRKLPAAGGFLVQAEHGGRSAPADPPPAALAAAERALAAVDAELLYARVDLLPGRDAWFLVELELVEPELFLRHHPEAPERFADAVVRWLDRP